MTKYEKMNKTRGDSWKEPEDPAATIVVEVSTLCVRKTLKRVFLQTLKTQMKCSILDITNIDKVCD